MQSNGYENKALKLNYAMRGHQAGDVVQVEVDKDGVPVDRYWRDRLKEAPHDKCAKWVETKKKGGK